MTTIEQVISWIPEWRGRPVTIERLTSGLTNINYRVDVEGKAFAVRIPGPSTSLLGVDRASELHNARVAAEAGVGPRVAHHFPESGITVAEFLQGRPVSKEDSLLPGMPRRIADVLRRLHGGPRFRNDLDMLGLASAYLAVLEARGLPLPPGLRGRRGALGRIQAALEARPWPAVPCHNDLVPENIIDDGTRLYLVDYEYSGNTDPAFDLGNACRELDYEEGRIEELCRAYLGAASVHALARIRLHMIVSDVTWALWAAIQAGISRLEFDFCRYGLTRWARAEAQMDTPEFSAWLDAGGHPDILN